MLSESESLLCGALLALGWGLVTSGEGGDDPPLPPHPQGKQAQELPTGWTVAGSSWVAAGGRYVGARWLLGGTGPEYDCSGLLWRAANDLGVAIPRVASAISAKSVPLDEGQAYRIPGALVVFHKRASQAVRHIEISTGRGTTLGSQVKGGVKIYSWGWWKTRKQQALWRVSYGRLPCFSAA